MTGSTIQRLSHSANPAIETWSWSSESNTRQRGTSSLHCHCARPAQTFFKNSGGGGENCTPDDLLCRQMPCCLGYTASNIGAEGGTRTRALDVGNVASWPLDDFRMERTARDLNSPLFLKPRAGGPRHQAL